MAEKIDTTEQAVDLINCYQWIFNFQNTNFFEYRPWRQLPCEWFEVLKQLSTDELNHLPFLQQPNPTWPSSLNNVILDAQSFSIDRNPINLNAMKMCANEMKGMNPKKRHEVEKLSMFVHSECERNSCGHIVDVGSGLGYVGKILSERFSHHVIGLEREEDRVIGADKMQQKCKENALLESRTFTLEDSALCYSNFDEFVCDITTYHSSNVIQSGRENELPQGDSDKCSLNESLVDSNQKCIERSLCAEKSWDFSCSTSVTSCNCIGLVSDTRTKCDIRCNGCDTGCHECDTHCSQCDKGYDTELHESVTQSLKCDASCTQCDTNCSQCGMRCTRCHTNRRVDAAERICMMGLHCCADLTPVMLKFFVRNSRLRSLICLGCCYHKMSVQDGKWNVFPMSDRLKRAVDKLQAYSIFTPFAMRLAAQETRSRWRTQSSEDHIYHMKNVAYRALLELFTKQEGICLQKTKRKVAGKLDYTNFDVYIQATLNSFSFKGLGEDYIKLKLQQLYEEHEQYFKYIELITCLQVIMQPVLESLIINDRVEFLNQHGLEAKAVALFSADISPRNIAIVASKS